MSPEPVTPLAAAARRRHQQATERARTALRQFEASGQPVTYAAVATAAQVSRAWLYTQPDIRAAADQLRRINGRSSNVPCPPCSGHPSRPLFAVWKPRTTAADSSAGRWPSYGSSSLSRTPTSAKPDDTSRRCQRSEPWGCAECRLCSRIRYGAYGTVGSGDLGVRSLCPAE